MGPERIHRLRSSSQTTTVAWRRAVLVAAAWLVSGCSTMEVQDVYRPVGESPGVMTDTVMAMAGFAPDDRFYSVGVAGMPVIPTHVAASDQDTLVFTVTLRLLRDADFSFAGRPCLVAGDEELCPVGVAVNAVAMARDDGGAYRDRRPRWFVLPEFRGPSPAFPPPTDARITKELLYARHGYRGAPWEQLRVDVAYTYRCAMVCSPNVSVAGRELLALDGEPVFTAGLDFERVREKDYRGMTEVQ